MVAVAVAVFVTVTVGVVVGVAVFVSVGVAVEVLVGVGVCVTVGVLVTVYVGVEVPRAIHTPTIVGGGVLSGHVPHPVQDTPPISVPAAIVAIAISAIMERRRRRI